MLGAAGSWLSAIRVCGGRLSLGDACARYGAGSLVNTFVPARAGDALRIGLFSRALPNRERLWTSGGAYAALGAARAVVLAALVVAGSLAGVMPLWPLFVLLGLVALGIVLAVRASRRPAGGRVSHILDAFRALGREPRAARPPRRLDRAVHGRAPRRRRPPSVRRSASASRWRRRS